MPSIDPGALSAGLVGLVGIFLIGIVGTAITLFWPAKDEKGVHKSK
jgi:hypothetical protein